MWPGLLTAALLASISEGEATGRQTEASTGSEAPSPPNISAVEQVHLLLSVSVSVSVSSLCLCLYLSSVTVAYLSMHWPSQVRLALGREPSTMAVQ